MKTLLLLVIAAVAVGGWFAPQMQEGTDGPCPALEKKMRATLPANSAMARAVAAETVKQLQQMPHGGGCVFGWWKLTLEQGATTASGR